MAQEQPVIDFGSPTELQRWLRDHAITTWSDFTKKLKTKIRTALVSGPDRERARFTLDNDVVLVAEFLPVLAEFLTEEAVALEDFFTPTQRANAPEAFAELVDATDDTLGQLLILWDNALEALDTPVEAETAEASAGLPDAVALAITTTAERIATNPALNSALNRWFTEWMQSEREEDTSRISWTEYEVAQVVDANPPKDLKKRDDHIKKTNQELTGLHKRYVKELENTLIAVFDQDLEAVWEVTPPSELDRNEYKPDSSRLQQALAAALSTAFTAHYYDRKERANESDEAFLGWLGLREQALTDPSATPLSNPAAVGTALDTVIIDFRKERALLLGQAPPSDEVEESGGGPSDDAVEQPLAPFTAETFLTDLETLLRSFANVMAAPSPLVGEISTLFGTLLTSAGAPLSDVTQVAQDPRRVLPVVSNYLKTLAEQEAVDPEGVASLQKQLQEQLLRINTRLTELIVGLAKPTEAPSAAPTGTAAPLPAAEDLVATPVGAAPAKLDKWEVARLQQRLTQSALFALQERLVAGGLTKAQAALMAEEFREALALELWNGLFIEASALQRQGQGISVNARILELENEIVAKQFALIVDTPLFRDAKRSNPELKKALQDAKDQGEYTLAAGTKLTQAEFAILLSALQPGQVEQLLVLTQEGASVAQFETLLRKLPWAQTLGTETELPLLAHQLADLSRGGGEFFAKLQQAQNTLGRDQQKTLGSLVARLQIQNTTTPGTIDVETLYAILGIVAPGIFKGQFLQGLDAAGRAEFLAELETLLNGNVELQGLLEQLQLTRLAQTNLAQYALQATLPTGARKHATDAAKAKIMRAFPMAYALTSDQGAQQAQLAKELATQQESSIAESDRSIRWQIAYSQAFTHIVVAQSEEFQTLLVLVQAGIISQEKAMYALEALNSDARGEYATWNAPQDIVNQQSFQQAMRRGRVWNQQRGQAAQAKAQQAQQAQKAAATARLAMDLIKSGGNPVGIAIAVLKNREAVKQIAKRIAAGLAAMAGLATLLAGLMLWLLTHPLEFLKFLLSNPAMIGTLLGNILPGWAENIVAGGLNAGLKAMSAAGNLLRGIGGLIESPAGAIASGAGSAGSAGNAVAAESADVLNRFTGELATTTKGTGALAAWAFLGPLGLIGAMTIFVITVIGGSLNDLPNGLAGLGLANNLCWPTSGIITQLDTPAHATSTGGHALDIGAPIGTPVYAPFSGMARLEFETLLGVPSGYGKLVRLQTDAGFELIFAHLNEYERNGQRYAIPPDSNGFQVQAGEVIGYVGSTGFSTGAHLHYEIIGRPMADAIPSIPPVGLGVPVLSSECEEVFNDTNLATEYEVFTENGGGVAASFNLAAAEFISYGGPGQPINLATFVANNPDLSVAINTNFFLANREISGPWVNEEGPLNFNSRGSTDEFLYFLNTNNVPEDVLAGLGTIAGVGNRVRYNNNGLLLIHTWPMNDTTLTALNDRLRPYVTDAVGGLPILVRAGTPEPRVGLDIYEDLRFTRARTIIGWRETPGGIRMYFIVLRPADLPAMIRVAQQFGLDYAIGLDGGGSSQMYASELEFTGTGANGHFLYPETEVRAVPAFMGVRPAR